ncbi:MAG: hypothetical protein P8Y34_09235 [Anaerolineales bacterium]
MNIFSTVLANKHSKITNLLVIAVGCFCLFWYSGCAAPRNDSNTLPDTSAPPTPTEPTTLGVPNEETEFCVVGIEVGQNLPLYQSHSRESNILGSIPPGGKSIHPLLGSSNENKDTWVEVDYHGLQGWAEKSHLAIQRGNLPEELVLLGQTVSASLQEADYGSLEEIIHPQLCLRFSPYQYLRDTDQVFCSEELVDAQHSQEPLVWGNYDGSGEPILLTFQEYHNKFVYDEDYFQPEVVGFDQEVSQGNAINNISDVYPDSIMIEYYFPGFDPQYGGMDWRSLRLVFVNQDGRWFLTALVHGEWTI